jgi:hypothetical protein
VITQHIALNYLDSFFAVLLGPSSDGCSGSSCISAFATGPSVQKDIGCILLCTMINLENKACLENK